MIGSRAPPQERLEGLPALRKVSLPASDLLNLSGAKPLELDDVDARDAVAHGRSGGDLTRLRAHAHSDEAVGRLGHAAVHLLEASGDEFAQLGCQICHLPIVPSLRGMVR